MNKSDKYYIASGFFTEEQTAVVGKLEETCRELRLNHFSPRSESVNFTKEEAAVKDAMTWCILNNNLDIIRNCNKFLCNLMDYDMGTVFELGFVAGKTGALLDEYGTKLFYQSTKVLNDTRGITDRIMEECTTKAEPNEKHEDLLARVATSILALNPELESKNAKLLKDFELVGEFVEDGKMGLICIDDRDPLAIFTAGFYIAHNIPVVTYSEREFGSNLMMSQTCKHYPTLEAVGEALLRIEADESIRSILKPEDNMEKEIL